MRILWCEARTNLQFQSTFSSMAEFVIGNDATMVRFPSMCSSSMQEGQSVSAHTAATAKDRTSCSSSKHASYSGPVLRACTSETSVQIGECAPISRSGSQPDKLGRNSRHDYLGEQFRAAGKWPRGLKNQFQFSGLLTERHRCTSAKRTTVVQLHYGPPIFTRREVCEPMMCANGAIPR